jgi:hypothetical protein
MDLREMGREVMDYIDLAPVDGSFEHGDETSGFHKMLVGKFLSSCKTSGFPRIQRMFYSNSLWHT